VMPPHQGPFRAPRQAPRWVRDLELLDTLLRELPEVAKQMEEVVAGVLFDADTQPLSDEQWMRALFVQQMSGRGDSDVSFYLNDSTACRAFCGLVEPIYIPDEKVATTH